MGGSNLVWSLIAVGVSGLFAMSLIGATAELELSYSDLEKLIRASGQAHQSPGWIELSTQGGKDLHKQTRYGDLQDVMIGAFQVSGTVGEQIAAEAASTPPTPPENASDGEPSESTDSPLSLIHISEPTRPY